MRPTARGGLAVAALASALLSGCDVGEVLDPDDSPNDSRTDPSVAASTEPAEPESTLPVGGTFEGTTSTTVEAIERGRGGPLWLPAGDGFEWLWATVRSCVPPNGLTTEVGWYQWAATGADGSWYPADLDYDSDVPSGQFLRLGDLPPGECADGEVLIAVPRDAEVVTLVNSDQNGMPQGTWVVGDVGAPRTGTDDG
jgi:hypothetical protein